MRRSALAAVAIFSLALGACSEQPTEVPVDPGADPPPGSVVQQSVADISSCPATSILSQIDALFPAGALRTSARSKFSSIPSKVSQRTGTAARDKMFALVDFILKTYYSGRLIGGTSTATQSSVFDLIESLYCFVRLETPSIPDDALGPDGAVAVVTPGSPTTLVLTGTKTAGVNIPAGAVPTTTTVAIARLPDSPGPLRTSLDQYPLFYEFLTQPEVTFNLDVTTGVCQTATFDPTTFARLRLAHNVAPFQFGDVEVLPRVTAAFLDCAILDAPTGPTLGMLQRHDFAGFASATWHAAVNGVLAPVARTIFLPDELHAAALYTCCLGGTTKKFSPFGAVDPESNPASLDYNSDATQSGSAGTAVAAPPSVLLSSANGTPTANVPVVFTITGGGGTVNGGSSATVLTGADGIATLTSWTLGSGETEATDQVTATAPAIAQNPSGATPSSGYRPAAAFNPLSRTFAALTGTSGGEGGSGGPFVQVSAGGLHTCGLKGDGTLSCWGATGSASPPSGATFIEVSAGGSHTCALKTDGKVACWGTQSEGGAPANQSPPDGTTFIQVSSGIDYACALASDGRVVCWGDNADGQAPGVVTPPAGTTFTQVSAGGYHACARASNGTLVCWGATSATPPSGTTFTQVSAGDSHTCALKTDGTVACWGTQAEGGAPANQSPPEGTTFIQVSSGIDYACALVSVGSVICWGENGKGQAPGTLTPPEGTTFTQVSAGGYHACARVSDGMLVCWGRDDEGQATPPTGTGASLLLSRAGVSSRGSGTPIAAH